MSNKKDITFHANGNNICYDDLGTGNIPIIFIHGFPFDKSMWQPQMDFFKKRYRVIAYDIRGFGKSTTGYEKISISLFADDLIRLMDGLLINKAIVCGLSMGGYILLNAIGRYPERFEAIILSDTQCIADSPDSKVKRYKIIEQLLTNGLTDFAEQFVQNIFCEDSKRSKKELVDRIKKIIYSTESLTIAGTLGAMAQRIETCSSLKEIAVPTLILCGKEDIITPPDQAQFLQCNIANSRLFSIENAGHMSNLEQPDEFNQHISNFISALLK
jgi:pimeloyl-ACP methyl ester carboxylesterase